MLAEINNPRTITANTIPVATGSDPFTPSPRGRRSGEQAAATKSPPINLTPNSIRVIEKRYLKKNSSGKVIETAEEMFHRVALCIASAEASFNPNADTRIWEEKFYDMMTKLEFLPNSPTLMNAGRELGQLSACFVLPIEDSMESIFEGVKNTALIHQSGGGTGFSFSRLRPESDRVGSTGGIASGPVSFIRVFDTATDVIKQGGMRRGANMAILNIDHPDILKFITAKEKSDSFTNFNFSVAISEKFMKAVETEKDYDLINPHTGKTTSSLNAKDVFDKIVDMAWISGDPGIVFMDRINKDNPTPNLGAIESTNPCGEQPLLPYESCNLGSINLARMLHQNRDTVEIDYIKLADTVKTAMRFLDNVIEVNKFPLDKIEKMSLETRKIGLGIMGFADALIRMGIPYNSEKALCTIKDIMQFISKEATAASVELGKERGLFPSFSGSIYDTPGGQQVRNATRTTIAPTGSLSIIAGCSSGIEPLFALCYTRNILDGEQFIEVNPLFEEIAKKEGFWSEDLMKELALRGSVRGMKEVPERIQEIFVTSHDIAPEWHIKMQASAQNFTDNAVSKTVNFPHDATREDIASVYMMAYKENCKGVTIYRDGSKEQQVLTINKTEESTDNGIVPRKRLATTSGFTKRVSTGCGSMYVTVNSDEQGMCEVFSTLGKAGGCASAQLEAISRLISLALRSRLKPEAIVNQLRGIRCPSIAWEKGHAILSCPDAIGGVLGGYLNNSNENNHNTSEQPMPQSNVGGQCPECSNLLVYQEGCQYCPSCGYTKCG
ncbi:MAG: vitamin B12-dependent ribonucleotide reductase [Dehalococcoidia bacterium]|nr:vitamin B12-dependent ribonucleotide reductase [Dehalococcoidia bacterium]